MPAWPAAVPCRFRLSSLTATSDLGSLIETPYAHGPAKRRRRFTGAIRQHNFTTGRLTLAQVAVFETWFVEDLAGGVLKFDMKHPRTRVLRQWSFAVGDQKYAVETLSSVAFSLSFTLDLHP